MFFRPSSASSARQLVSILWSCFAIARKMPFSGLHSWTFPCLHASAFFTNISKASSERGLLCDQLKLIATLLYAATETNTNPDDLHMVVHTLAPLQEKQEDLRKRFPGSGPLLAAFRVVVTCALCRSTCYLYSYT